MLTMAWTYRDGCVQPLLIQLVLLSLNVLGLSLGGLGVDVILHGVDGSRKMPSYPLGLLRPGTWSPMMQVVAIAGAIVLFSLVRGVLNFRYTIAVSRLIQGRLVVDLRAAVYDKLQRLSFRFYDNNETGAIINRVTGDVQGVSGFINGIVLQVVMLVLSLMVYFTYMLKISPRLTFACLATTPILWYASFLFGRTMKAAYRKNRELYDRLILVLSENLSGMHVVKGFSLQNQQIARFRDANVAYKKQQRWMFFWNAAFNPAIGYLTQINMAILLGYGGWMVLRGQLEFGTGLMVMLGLLANVSGQVQGLAQLSNSIQQSLVAAKRVFEVLDAPVEIQSPVKSVALKKSRGKLEFRNVSFEFTPGKPVLREISFVVEPGQSLALLGPTGSGKSVLLSLIPRFYDPTSGSILIDDVDIRQYDLQDLRKTMGLVFQETFLFSNTVGANIAFGVPGATQQQIEAAARISKAHQFIEPLSKGYETVLSEGGNNLSGGQRQRLAIARAMILEPAFLLMDDPMASVDAQTEHEMSEAIASATTGRTTILAANRISTLRRADVILVLQKGRVVQKGTHDQLMVAPGYYRETARLQIDEETRKASAAMGVTV